MPEAAAPLHPSAPPLRSGDAVSPSPATPLTDGAAAEYKTLAELCKGLHDQVYEFLAEDTQDELLRRVQARTRESLGIIKEALERYSLPELSFSYNGGKDCLVLLILYLAQLSTLPQGTLPLSLESIYIVPPHPFTLVDTFVAASAFRYHLSLTHLTHPSMKAAFASYLSSHPSIRAIFVGTRRTDPHGANLTSFDMTDGGWPEFMRIHPVLDWRYAEVWGFLKRMNVDWCELYDRGYTSLGGTRDTAPNPKLKRPQSEGGGYWPAWYLVEDGEERAGRDREVPVREGEDQELV